jgi:hypothetical protein
VYFTSRFPDLPVPVQKFEEKLTPQIMSSAAGIDVVGWNNGVNHFASSGPLVIFSKVR